MNPADLYEVFTRLGEVNKPLLDERHTEDFVDDPFHGEGPVRLGHPLEEGEE